MGQTYPHRLWIKELGGTFQGARKVWRVPFSEKNLLTVNEYCTKHGGGSLSLESKTKSYRKRMMTAKASSTFC